MNINPGDKLIIGTGDSYTQGLGAYPSEIWQKYNYEIDCVNADPKLVDELIPYMYQSSWVNQLCKTYLTDYKPINLGIMGTGNRAAAKELFLNPIENFNKIGKSTVIYMMSGIERFDFINRDFPNRAHFFSMWPSICKKSGNKKLWDSYARDIWSEEFTVIETIINIVDVQNYCKVNNLNLIVTSGFDWRINLNWFSKILPDNFQYLLDRVDWENFCYPQGCNSFLELLLRLDGHTDEEVFKGDYYKIYYKTNYRSKYITPCIHPTQEGHKIIANELYNFMKQKKWID